MTYSVDTLWVNEYSDNITQLSQQRNSVLENFVTMGSCQGEYKYFDRIDAVSMTQRSASLEDTSYTDVAHTKRVVDFDDYDITFGVDKRDLKRVLTDPGSVYVESAVSAWKRTIDDVIIAAATGTALTGKGVNASFGSQTFLTATQTVDVLFQAGDPIGAGNGTGSRTGFTKAKFLKARSVILKNHALAPGESLYCAIGADEEMDLIDISEFKSRDFRAEDRLIAEMDIDPSGIIGYWYGCLFLRSTRLATVDPASADNDYRRCLMWAKSGIGMVRGDAPSVEVMPNPSKKMARTIHVEGSVGAVRLEETKVVEIRTKDTADAS